MDTKQQLQNLIDKIKDKKLRDSVRDEANSYIAELRQADREYQMQSADDMATRLAQMVKDKIGELRVESPDVNVPEIEIDTQSIVDAIKQIQISVPASNVSIPEIRVPDINVPESKVVMPEYMKVDGEVSLRGVNKVSPLPVTLMAEGGKPFVFPISAGGGKADFFTIKDIRASSISVIDQDVGAVRVVGNLTASLASSTMVTITNFDGLAYNSDNPLPVTGSFSSTPAPQVSGYADSVNVMQYGGVATPTGLNETNAGVFRVVQMTDSINSVAVKEIFGSTVSSDVLNADNRIRVSVETGGSGLTDTELRASSVPVSQVSGASWSTSVTDVFGSTGTNVINPDGRLKVELPTGSSGLTDTELRATSVPVEQVSGSMWSTAVKEIFGSTITTLLNGDNRIPVSIETGGTGLTDSELRATAVPVSQLSGASWSTEATQSGTWNIGTVTTVTGITNSLATNIIDSSGVAYSGSNPVPAIITQGGNTASIGTSGADDESNTSARLNVRSHMSLYDGTTWDRARGDSTNGMLVNLGSNNDVTVTGSISSTVVTGPTVADTADDGSAPIQTGGIARTANPTAVANGDVVKSSYDDLGRQLVRHQVRDLQQSAYVQLTNGTETTLASGVSGTYLDLVWLIGANNSDAAVSVDFRSGTAGSVKLTLQIPAYGTAGASLGADPIQQEVVAGTWTADMPDITGTTVSLSALFNKEI